MNRGGVVIREARRRAGLSQADLGRRLHTSQAAVWRWERGVVEPPWAAVARAVSACGLSLRPVLDVVDPDEWGLVLYGRDRSPGDRLRQLEAYSRFAVAGRAAVKRALARA